MLKNVDESSEIEKKVLYCKKKGMKLLQLSIILILSSFLFSNCSNKKNVEKYELSKIGKSVESYYFDRNVSSEYFTKINKLEPISYTTIEDSTATYMAKVYFEGIITMNNGGSRKYDIRDTLFVYLNKDFKVLNIKQEH